MFLCLIIYFLFSSLFQLRSMGPIIAVLALVLYIESNVKFTLAENINNDTSGISNGNFIIIIIRGITDSYPIIN